ncbi:MAG TPA: hypothetical protein VIV58_36310 [Kofleriaceae bacterium]
MLPKLRVGLSPIWAGFFFALAGVDAYVWLGDRSTLVLLFAVALAAAGVAHLFGALLVVDDHVIDIKSPLGPTMRTFRVESPQDLKIEGRKMFVKSGGETRRISGVMANGRHWKQLADAILTAQSAQKS